MAAHRSLVVGGGSLALARHLGGHEAHRVELGVGVLERGARVGALVDDQVDVRGLRAWRASAPARRRRRLAKRGSSSSASEVACSGRVDDHLVRALGGLRAEQVGVGPARGGPQWIGGAREARLRLPGRPPPSACERTG